MSPPDIIIGWINAFKPTEVAKCNLGKVNFLLQDKAASGLLLMCMWSVGWPQGPFAYLVTFVASHAGIFELIFADLLLKWIFADSGSQPVPPILGIGKYMCMGSGEYFPLNSFSVMVRVGCCMQGWFLLAGLPWIPPCYAWGTQAPIQPLRHQFPSSSIGDEFNYLEQHSVDTWNSIVITCIICLVNGNDYSIVN